MLKMKVAKRKWEEKCESKLESFNEKRASAIREDECERVSELERRSSRLSKLELYVAPTVTERASCKECKDNLGASVGLFFACFAALACPRTTRTLSLTRYLAPTKTVSLPILCTIVPQY